MPTDASREGKNSKLEATLHIMSGTNKIEQEIEEHSNFKTIIVKVSRQPTDIVVESNRPKTIISVTDKDSLVCVSSKPTTVVFFSHLSTGLYLIVGCVSIAYVLDYV